MSMINNTTGDALALMASRAIAIDLSGGDVAIEVTNGGISVGTGGDVEVTLKQGTRVIYKNRPDGSQLNVMAVIIHAAGTTATDLLAQY